MTYNIFIFLAQSIHKSKLISYNLEFILQKEHTLTKTDIVNSVKDQIRFTRKQSIETAETLLEIMKKTLESGEDVLISNFGKFCVRDKRERRGRNPATGDDMMLQPRRVVTFKCSGKLRKKINGKRR